MIVFPGYVSIVGLAVGLLALIVASLFDIKTREVPDWISYSLLAFSLGSAVMLTIYHGDFQILFNALLGLAAGLAIGLLMFYSGQWGGGDSKLIIALASLIGISFSDFRQGIPLFFVFLINILLVGSIYGLFFSMIKALINYKKFKIAVEEKLRSKEVLILRIILLVIGVGAFIYLLATKSIESALIFGLAMALFLFFYLWAFVTTVEKTCMIKKLKVSQLTDGDWIVGDVKKGNKIILKASKTGITLEQIAKLKRRGVREVMVKIGIPFIPSFLIAYILTFTLGNWMIFFI
jgi:Flp pilus assembly protein protease CpaA